MVSLWIVSALAEFTKFITISLNGKPVALFMLTGYIIRDAIREKVPKLCYL